MVLIKEFLDLPQQGVIPGLAPARHRASCQSDLISSKPIRSVLRQVTPKNFHRIRLQTLEVRVLSHTRLFAPLSRAHPEYQVTRRRGRGKAIFDTFWLYLLVLVVLEGLHGYSEGDFEALLHVVEQYFVFRVEGQVKSEVIQLELPVDLFIQRLQDLH